MKQAHRFVHLIGTSATLCASSWHKRNALCIFLAQAQRFVHLRDNLLPNENNCQETKGLKKLKLNLYVSVPAGLIAQESSNYSQCPQGVWITAHLQRYFKAKYSNS